MLYEINWRKDAINDLAAAYNAAKDDGRADDLASAIHRLEKRLAANPLEHSESREGHHRVAFAMPLSFDLLIDERRKIVFVLHVRYCPPLKR